MTPCDLCPRTTRLVCGNGPEKARVMAIGEAPGKDEDRTGIPFVGQSGKEFNENYLVLAGLDRSEIYVTNTRKCRPENNRKPTSREASVCASHHLPGEIAQVQPEVIFLLGSTACGLVPDIQLDVEHGIPRRGKLWDWEGWIVPMYHPASGLHDTAMMIPMLSDWQDLAPFLNGQQSGLDFSKELDEYPETDYRLARSVKEFENYMTDHVQFDRSWMAIDTESHCGEYWSIQISIEPGSAVMVLREDTSVFETAILYVNHWRDLVFHNAPADLPLFNVKTYRDTMQECYQLGNLQQALKTLGYRLFGVRMQSWEDLVTPYSQIKLLGWMVDAIMFESQHPVIEYEELKTKVKEIIKPNDTERALTRIMKHAANGDTYDPWERLDGMDLRRTEQMCGVVPRRGIANVPLNLAVKYACRDADMTLRLALKLEELRKEFDREHVVIPEDCDVPLTSRQPA